MSNAHFPLCGSAAWKDQQLKFLKYMFSSQTEKKKNVT